MDGTVELLIAAILIASVIAWKRWLRYKTERRISEINKERTALLLGFQKNLVEHTERMASFVAQSKKNL